MPLNIASEAEGGPGWITLPCFCPPCKPPKVVCTPVVCGEVAYFECEQSGNDGPWCLDILNWPLGYKKEFGRLQIPMTYKIVDVGLGHVSYSWRNPAAPLDSVEPTDWILDGVPFMGPNRFWSGNPGAEGGAAPWFIRAEAVVTCAGWGVSVTWSPGFWVGSLQWGWNNLVSQAAFPDEETQSVFCPPGVMRFRGGGMGGLNIAYTWSAEELAPVLAMFYRGGCLT